MSWVPVAFAVLLLLVVVYPFVEPRLTQGRRARRAHRGGVVHVYPNYDEDLSFEPRMSEDIVAVRRIDLIDLGFQPRDESTVVPRTFRRRVAGDVHLELWKSTDHTLRGLWVCAWHGVEVPITSVETAPHSRLTRQMLLRSNSGPLSPLKSDDIHDQLLHDPPELALAEWAEEGDLDGQVMGEPFAALVRLSQPIRSSRVRSATTRQRPRTGRRSRRNRRRGRRR